jgi:hypothetical protein
MIRTNTNDYKNRMKSYLLDSIEDVDNTAEMTPREKIDFFFEDYTRQYDYPQNQRRYPNNQERLSQFLQGLPSSICLPFDYCEIIKLAAKLHGCEIPKSKESNIINNYWSHMAFHLMRLKETA